MKYVFNEDILEAFRIGIDPIPDWFMDKVTKNEAVLCEDDWHNTRAKLHSETNMEYFVNYGDYIMRDPEGAVGGFTKSYVDSHYTRIIEDEPVNAAKPVDPEKERLEALQEHYWSIAKEIKLAHDCLISVGFKEDDAFLILLRLMENPIEPAKKKSKEELELTMARLRAERRAKKDVEELVNRVNPRKERVNND